jgi:hypothetical protein
MALTYNQITAIAQNTIDKTLTDNVFKATPVLARMRAKSKKYSGGVKIQVPVISSSSTSGGWYTDLGPLTIDRTDNISAAEFDWRQAYESVRISRLDLAKCSGDSAKLDLVASKIKVAEEALAARLTTGIFGSGGSNQFDGFGAMIAASGTYGGIAPADLAEWVSPVHLNGAVDRAVSLALIQKLDGACTNGKTTPSMFVSRQNVFDEVYNLFTAFQRIESEEVGKLGFKSLIVNGKPLVVDAACAAKSILAINESHAHLAIHKDNDMRKEHHGSLETSDSSLTKIFFMGNLVCNQRRAHGRLGDLIAV